MKLSGRVIYTIIGISLLVACNVPPVSPNYSAGYLQKKDGESCLINQQCKVLASTDDGRTKRYFKCLISNDYYQIIDEGSAIRIDTNKCQEVLP